MRHLGMVRSHSSDPETRQLLLTEMWCRALKNLINRLVRAQSYEKTYLSEVFAKRLVSQLLNLLLGSEVEFYEWYWTADEEKCPKELAAKVSFDFVEWVPSCKYTLREKFGVTTLNDHEMQPSVNVSPLVNLMAALHRLNHLSWFQMSHHSLPHDAQHLPCFDVCGYHYELIT